MAGMGLTCVIQGIAGQLSTTGKPKHVQAELNLWDNKLKGFTDERKFSTWDKASSSAQAMVADKIADAACEKWPAMVVETIVKRWKEKQKAAR